MPTTLKITKKIGERCFFSSDSSKRTSDLIALDFSWKKTKQDLTDYSRALKRVLWCRSREILKLKEFDCVQVVEYKSQVKECHGDI